MIYSFGITRTMKKEDENKIMFEFRWIFTPDTEIKEENDKYRSFLKKMYLESVTSSLVLKNEESRLLSNYKMSY